VHYDRIAHVRNTRNLDVCSENLHSRSVTKVELEQDGAMLVSSDGKETYRQWWDVVTGARKDKVAGQFAFTKAGIGRYIETKKDDLIFVDDSGGCCKC
jgi:hypothetical protein